MNQATTELQAHHAAKGLSVFELLGIGSMLASIAVVAFAGLQADDGATRTPIVLQGLALVLINVGAGAASVLIHRLINSPRQGRRDDHFAQAGV